MKFKKRFLMVFCTMALLAGMLGGGGVAAAENKVTLNELIAMNDGELAKVPNDTLKAVLDDLAQLTLADINKLGEKQIERIYQQWVANCERATLDSISRIPLPATDSIDILTIGTHASVYLAEYGWYTTGGAQSLAQYNVDANRQEAVTQIAIGGSDYGTAYTGFTFYVDGEYSAVADVSVSGWLAAVAFREGIGFGSSNVKYQLVIEKITGSSNDKAVTIKELNGNPYQSYFGGVSTTTYYLFEPGYWYRITMVINSSGWYGGAGGAVADAYGYSTHFSEWDWVDIEWW